MEKNRILIFTGILMLVGIALTMILLIGGGVLYISSKSSVESELQFVDTVLKQGPFQVDQARYPQHWPEHSTFVDLFELASLRTGDLPGEDIQAWVTRLNFYGGWEESFELIVEHFESLGWEIEIIARTDPGGVICHVNSSKGEFGIVIIEEVQSEPSRSILSITIYR